MFALGLIPLSLILRKAKAAYEFSGSKVKINNILFIDDLKLYRRNEKELDSLVKEIEKGKIMKSVGIELPDGKVIKSLQEGESYKYLRILEVEDEAESF